MCEENVSVKKSVLNLCEENVCENKWKFVLRNFVCIESGNVCVQKIP